MPKFQNYLLRCCRAAVLLSAAHQLLCQILRSSTDQWPAQKKTRCSLCNSNKTNYLTPILSHPWPCWWWFFILSGSPPIQNKSSNQNLGTPSVGTQNEPLKPPPTFLGLDVPNLQILQIGDIPGMSTSSIMPFHNHVSKLVHWLSQGQQNWPRGLFFFN